MIQCFPSPYQRSLCFDYLLHPFQRFQRKRLRAAPPNSGALLIDCGMSGKQVLDCAVQPRRISTRLNLQGACW